MKKDDEYSRRMAELMKLAERCGVKVKESSVGSIGFVGGVRRPKPESADDSKLGTTACDLPYQHRGIL